MTATIVTLPPRKKSGGWFGAVAFLAVLGGCLVLPGVGIFQNEKLRAEQATAVEATQGVCDLAPAASPIRTSLDARCDTLRCPPGTHAEWRPRMLGAMPDPRCVEGP